MRKPPNWEDREDYIFTIEKASSTLTIIANACGNGEYADTARIEEALTLIADTVREAAESLRAALWHDEDSNQTSSPAFLEYRRRFDAWVQALGASDNKSADAADALREATVVLLSQPVLTWGDVAQLGIVVHDHAWNRKTQNYRARDCPEDILKALIMGIRKLAERDQGLSIKRYSSSPAPEPSARSIAITN